MGRNPRGNLGGDDRPALRHVFVPALPGSMYVGCAATVKCFRSTVRHGRCSSSISATSCTQLFIHRISNKALSVLVICLGLLLGAFALTDYSGYGYLGIGWTLDGVNFAGGMLRMLFPFTLGMLVPATTNRCKSVAPSGFARRNCC